MTSGIMPPVGVPAGDSRVVGGISVAPLTDPPAACPVQYYKAGCAAPNDRQQWNWLISNLIQAQNSCGLDYDCTSPDQLRELICCLARSCVYVCRSTVTPTPVAWPPVAYSGPFVVDDTVSPAVLYYWDCTDLVYVELSTGGTYDFCTAVPSNALVTTEPVYAVQCIAGVGRRVEITPVTPMTCVSGAAPLQGPAAWCTASVIAASVVGGAGDGLWTAEFAANYPHIDPGAGATQLQATVMYRKNGGAWVPIHELRNFDPDLVTLSIYDSVVVGPRTALSSAYGGNTLTRPATNCSRKIVPYSQNGAHDFPVAGYCSGGAAYYSFTAADTIEFGLRGPRGVTDNVVTDTNWQVTFLPA